MSKSRMYEDLWSQIKRHGQVTIDAPAHLHKRIIKAVHKEKGIDYTFNLLNRTHYTVINRSLFTSTNSAEDKITFILSQGVKPDDLA